MLTLLNNFVEKITIFLHSSFSGDYNRLKTARSLFSNVVNTPMLKFVPIVLVFTKADLCVMEDSEKITELIHSFIILNKRQMSIRVLLSDNTSAKKVQSLFVGLMRATIELGIESSKLSEEWRKSGSRDR